MFLAMAVGVAGAQEQAGEEALSRLLLDRPSRSQEPIPGGLRGAYTNPRRVTLGQMRPCFFRLFEDGLSENGDRGSDWSIDFNKVTAITVELVDRPKPDPAVARLYRIAPARGKAVRVTFVGGPDQHREVFCHVKVCWGDTLSFLQPAAHLEDARQAAVAFRARCPGPAERRPLAPPLPR